MAFRVGVEEVVGARIVLVDAPLDEPHAEHAGVEVEVLLRRSGDRGDVMQPVDTHGRNPQCPLVGGRAGESTSKHLTIHPS